MQTAHKLKKKQSSIIEKKKSKSVQEMNKRTKITLSSEEKTNRIELINKWQSKKKIDRISKNHPQQNQETMIPFLRRRTLHIRGEDV